MIQPNDYLFCYGTLRKGGRWNRILEDSYSHPGTCFINGTLYQWSTIPILKIGGPNTVYGELFKLHDPEVISRVISLERGYECSKISVETMDHEFVDAWVFHRTGDFEFDQVIESGDWLKHVEGTNL